MKKVIRRTGVLSLIILLSMIMMAGPARGTERAFKEHSMKKARRTAVSLVLEEVQESIRPSPGSQTAFPVRVNMVRSSPQSSPVLLDMYFDEARRMIAGDSAGGLYEVAELLDRHPRWMAEIEGHCDERGNASYNLALANLRLQEVSEFLETLGVAPARIRRRNYGGVRMLCGDGSHPCPEGSGRLKTVFRLLALAHTRRGCLLRLRLVSKGRGETPLSLTQREPFLQRIHVGSSWFPLDAQQKKSYDPTLGLPPDS